MRARSLLVLCAIGMAGLVLYLVGARLLRLRDQRRLVAGYRSSHIRAGTRALNEEESRLTEFLIRASDEDFSARWATLGLRERFIIAFVSHYAQWDLGPRWTEAVDARVAGVRNKLFRGSGFLVDVVEVLKDAEASALAKGSALMAAVRASSEVGRAENTGPFLDVAMGFTAADDLWLRQAAYTALAALSPANDEWNVKLSALFRAEGNVYLREQFAGQAMVAGHRFALIERARLLAQLHNASPGEFEDAGFFSEMLLRGLPGGVDTDWATLRAFLEENIARFSFRMERGSPKWVYGAGQ